MACSKLLNTLAATLTDINKRDKDHFAYINFTPHDSETYVKIFERLPLNFLSYDYYCIRTSQMRPDHYTNLYEARKAANMMAVPLWQFTCSVIHKDCPLATKDHLRFQLFSDMVFGAQGFQFFTYTVPMGADADMEYSTALLDKSGNKTSVYYDSQTVIAEIQNYREYLLGAQSLWIMGNADPCLAAPAQSKLPYPLTSVSTSGKYIISHSCNDGHEYLLVFNASCVKGSTITLRFSKDVQLIQADGTLSSPMSGSVSADLTAGGLAVYKLN